jgi:hypothetical protein
MLWRMTRILIIVAAIVGGLASAQYGWGQQPYAVGEVDPAQARHAVVRVKSHGGSATVIATGPGRTLFLSAAHMFEGRDRTKPIVLDAPAPATSAPQRYGTRVIDVDHQHDLALFELYAGPLPYVAPVAPLSQLTSRTCLSVGYDEQVLSPTMRPANIVRQDRGDGFTLTTERPWHGRSGGALIDEASGQLVGVVSGYSGPRNHQETWPGGQGIYAGHGAIVTFLRRNGYEATGSPLLPAGSAPYRPPAVQTPAPRLIRRDCPT